MAAVVPKNIVSGFGAIRDRTSTRSVANVKQKELVLPTDYVRIVCFYVQGYTVLRIRSSGDFCGGVDNT